MKRKIFHTSLTTIYPLTDFMVVAFSIMASYKLYRLLGIGQSVIYQKSAIIPLSFLIGLAAVVVMWGFGVYKQESSVLNVEEIKNTVKGATSAYIIFMLILVFGQFTLSRYVMFFSFVLSIILLVSEKTVFYHFHALSRYIKKFHKRVLIYGAGELGQALYRELKNSPKFNIDPVGFIDDNPAKLNNVYHQSGFYSENGINVLGTRQDISRLKEELNIDEIYIAISNINYQTLMDIMKYLKKENIRASFVPNLYKLFIHKIKMYQIGHIPLVKEEEEEEGKTFYNYLKRYFDLLLALISSILLCPLFLVLSLAIKIDSKGPVFFKQDRVGKDGKVFQIYKFRSMFMDVDPYAVNPLSQDDPRITKVGRFLRKTSLDELPQIINVIRGDMSMVGPRPEMPFIVAEYNEIHKERLKVLPGITGLWQLSGDRKKAIHENMDYDIYYIRNASFFLDVAILIETLIFAFRGI